jgi:hypothetical protein
VLGVDGLPSFDRLRFRRRDASVILVAFDLRFAAAEPGFLLALLLV